MALVSLIPASIKKGRKYGDEIQFALCKHFLYVYLLCETYLPCLDRFFQIKHRLLCEHSNIAQMAQEQAPLNVKTLTEIMGLGSAILETDDGLANYLFPSEESNAPRITQDIVQQISAQQSLQDRVNRAFLQVMKSYGFYRYRVKPLRIRLRPAQPRKKDPARALLTASNHHHDRIARILSLLRLLGLEEEARAFYETLSSADRITETVSEASKTQWSRAMSEHVSVFVAEAPPVQTLSGEEASFLERLLRDGEARFGKRKRSTDVPDDGDASPATKKRNMDAGIIIYCFSTFI